MTEAPPAEEPHSAAYAGAAFGIVAAIAAGSLYRKCNKKINANEEPLLWVLVPYHDSIKYWK